MIFGEEMVGGYDVKVLVFIFLYLFGLLSLEWCLSNFVLLVVECLWPVGAIAVYRSSSVGIEPRTLRLQA